MIDAEAVRRAVGPVLFSVSNYPERAQIYMLGQDFSPLLEKVVSAVVALDEPTDRERIRAELIDSLPPSPKSAIWVDGVLARAFER